MSERGVDSERFLRQMILVEVGTSGQLAIEATEARLHGESLAHEVATLYALGAGFRSVVGGEIEATRGDADDDVEDMSARAVLAGSRGALAEIRRALATSQPPNPGEVTHSRSGC